MNTSGQINTYKSQQSSNPYPDVSDYSGMTQGIFIVTIILSVILFVLWVWSMISMIMLNGRFKDFLYEYERREATRTALDLDPQHAHKTLAVDPLENDELNERPRKKISTKQLNVTLIVTLSVLIVAFCGMLIFSMS